jgi:biopolymer transport protein TolR
MTSALQFCYTVWGAREYLPALLCSFSDQYRQTVMAFVSPTGKGPMSDINVTPLVDVMLVLLIIFMITAPMMSQGVEVNLPETEHATPLEANEDRLLLTITAEQRAYLGTSEIPMDRIAELLATNARLQKEKEIYLHADHQLPYGVVVKVMAAAKKGGAESMAMVTDPVAPTPKKAKQKKGKK